MVFKVFNNLKLHEPDFTIDLKDLNSSNEIYQICRNKGITGPAVYIFGYWNQKSAFEKVFVFLKVGQTNPSLEEKRKSQVCERLVRQSSWLPGWNTKPNSDHGIDFAKNIEKDRDSDEKWGITPIPFNKDLITIGIWDMQVRIDAPRSTDFFNTNKKHPIFVEEGYDIKSFSTCWAEGELVHQHKTSMGVKPLFNKQDPSNNSVYKSMYVDPNAIGRINQLFSGLHRHSKNLLIKEKLTT